MPQYLIGNHYISQHPKLTQSVRLHIRLPCHWSCRLKANYSNSFRIMILTNMEKILRDMAAEKKDAIKLDLELIVRKPLLKVVSNVMRLF